jgi:hypothetical protein
MTHKVANYRAGVDGGIPPLFEFERRRPRAQKAEDVALLMVTVLLDDVAEFPAAS